MRAVAAKPAPRARVRDALRERILSGAAAAFSRHGYAGTRVEDIIAETGISRPTFYKVFEGKDAVFVALSERHHGTIRARLREAIASSADPLVRVERSVESFLRWRTQLGPVGRVIDLDARSPVTLLSQHRKQVLDYVVRTTRNALREAGRPDVDPVMLRAMVAAAEHVADELLSEAHVSESTLQRAKAIVLRMQLGALAEPSEIVPALGKR
jgi:TetR/AcrR family transcriptional regulator